MLEKIQLSLKMMAYGQILLLGLFLLIGFSVNRYKKKYVVNGALIYLFIGVPFFLYQGFSIFSAAGISDNIKAEILGGLFAWFALVCGAAAYSAFTAKKKFLKSLAKTDDAVESESLSKKEVSSALGIGVFLMPYVFSWFLLRKGYSTKARAVGFIWLIVVCVMLWQNSTHS